MIYLATLDTLNFLNVLFQLFIYMQRESLGSQDEDKIFTLNKLRIVTCNPPLFKIQATDFKFLVHTFTEHNAGF